VTTGKRTPLPSLAPRVLGDDVESKCRQNDDASWSTELSRTKGRLSTRAGGVNVLAMSISEKFMATKNNSLL